MFVEVVSLRCILLISKVSDRSDMAQERKRRAKDDPRLWAGRMKLLFMKRGRADGGAGGNTRLGKYLLCSSHLVDTQVEITKRLCVCVRMRVHRKHAMHAGPEFRSCAVLRPTLVAASAWWYSEPCA